VFAEISGGLVKSLQDKTETLDKDSILSRNPRTGPGPLPTVFVYSPEFSFADVGLGGEGTDVKEEKKESFNGDAENTTFILSGRAQRPLLRVESAAGQVQIEGPDYTMDYVKGRLNFRSAPPKGKGNVIVKYNSATGGGRTKEIHLDLVYNVDVWASSEKQRDDITVDAIKAIVLSQDEFTAKGIQLKPVKGLDLYADKSIPDGVFAKRLVYSVEANLQVKVPASRIERVDVRQLPNE
jgi:hypothetical protein